MSTINAHEARQIANYEAITKLTRNQELYNPCLKEHNLSYKCLDQNDYDKDKCAVFFENYKKCKSFWKMVMTDRRLHGIKPQLPVPEEREKVKANYLDYQKQ